MNKYIEKSDSNLDERLKGINAFFDNPQNIKKITGYIELGKQNSKLVNDKQNAIVTEMIRDTFGQS